ncbi:hypothetical protein PAECIP111891_04217 [Paenibacillus allorhizoplanae]|uniref:Uncharacterized protein n=1 Tax=Paenibacillus allorhizoplanae TaxID=2905648 RepID=A0ABM9CKM0_9BACL|nr:hypothetical protein PAECIP111891_04217 [Paenibacillus allorhizoplanae]
MRLFNIIIFSLNLIILFLLFYGFPAFTAGVAYGTVSSNLNEMLSEYYPYYLMFLLCFSCNSLTLFRNINKSTLKCILSIFGVIPIIFAIVYIIIL